MLNLQIDLPEEPKHEVQFSESENAKRESFLTKLFTNDYENGGIKKLLERKKLYEDLINDKDFADRPGLIANYKFGLKIVNQVIEKVKTK